MNWIYIAFWICFGLTLTGLFAVPDLVIGIFALIIGIASLATELRRNG